MEERTEYEAEAAVVADLTESRTRIEYIAGAPYAMRPGEPPLLIEQAIARPLRVHMNPGFDTLADFAKWVNEHDEPMGRAAVFADQSTMRAIAVFDLPRAADDPQWGTDRARYELQHDPRLTEWLTVAGAWLSQEEFVDLLEDNQSTIVSPSGAEMLSVAENLELHRKDKVVARRNRTSGTAVLRFESEEGETSTPIPEQMTIGCPIFEGVKTADGKLAAYQIVLRIRYRIRDGKVVFRVAPVDLDDVLTQAWDQVVSLLIDALNCDVYQGEAPTIFAA